MSSIMTVCRAFFLFDAHLEASCLASSRDIDFLAINTSIGCESYGPLRFVCSFAFLAGQALTDEACGGNPKSTSFSMPK